MKSLTGGGCLPGAPGDGDVGGRNVGDPGERELRPRLGAGHAFWHDADRLPGAGGLEQVLEDCPLAPTRSGSPRNAVSRQKAHHTGSDSLTSIHGSSAISAKLTFARPASGCWSDSAT